MQLTKNNLGKYEFLPQINTLHWEWNPKTEHASWSDMQEAMIEYAEAAERFKAENHIINEKHQGFTFVPDYQIWIDNNVSPRTVASGCKRFALVKSDDLFIEVAVQQIFEEQNTSQMQLQIFNTFDQAKDWIQKSIKA